MAAIWIATGLLVFFSSGHHLIQVSTCTLETGFGCYLFSKHFVNSRCMFETRWIMINLCSTWFSSTKLCFSVSSLITYNHELIISSITSNTGALSVLPVSSFPLMQWYAPYPRVNHGSDIPFNFFSKNAFFSSVEPTAVPYCTQIPAGFK